MMHRRLASLLLLAASAMFAVNASATPPSPVNECTYATATVMTGQSSVAIGFGGGLGFAYSPNCVRVDPGTSMMFNGAFSTHPLRGGQVIGGVQTLDPSSPVPSTSSGSTTSFTLSQQGVFGYYCNNHGSSSNMFGAIVVGAGDTVFSDAFE